MTATSRPSAPRTAGRGSVSAWPRRAELGLRGGADGRRPEQARPVAPEPLAAFAVHLRGNAGADVLQDLVRVLLRHAPGLHRRVEVRLEVGDEGVDEAAYRLAVRLRDLGERLPRLELVEELLLAQAEIRRRGVQPVMYGGAEARNDPAAMRRPEEQR